MDEQPRRKKRPVPPARRFAAKRMYSLAAGFAVAGLLVGFLVGRATAPVADPEDAKIEAQPDPSVQVAAEVADVGPSPLLVISYGDDSAMVDQETWRLAPSDRSRLIEVLTNRFYEGMYGATHDSGLSQETQDTLKDMRLSTMRMWATDAIDKRIKAHRDLHYVLSENAETEVEYNRAALEILNRFNLEDGRDITDLQENMERHVRIALAAVRE